MKRLLDAGKIVNTHGVRGELRVIPWCDNAEFLLGFKSFYIDGKPVYVSASRVHKSNLLLKLKGVEDVNSAMLLKNKVLQIDRQDVKLPEGTYFIADMIGLKVLDDATNNEIGKIAEVLNLPANDVYIVRGEREYMIPAVKAFIVETNVQDGYIRVKMQKGLAVDED